MDEKKIKVKLLPMHNIGGVGNAGDVVWMSAADAEMYVHDGYVEVVEEIAPPAVPALPVEEEHHVIMKPHAKPAKKRK